MLATLAPSTFRMPINVIFHCGTACMVLYAFLVAGLRIQEQYQSLGFFGCGTAALIIALFTVSFQAIRVAVANPVDALRSE